MKQSSGPSSKNFYLIALAVRFVFVFIGFGYLHPDSFFQSSEVIAGDVFDFQVNRPWEFSNQFSLRSILSPAIFSGLPFMALKALSYVIPSVVNSYTLFYLPRLFLFVASLILDRVVYRLSGKDYDALLTLATSWPMFSFILTSFSNTVETIVLALAVYVVLRNKRKTWNEYVMFGAIVAFGEFARVTFLLYAFPLVLFLIYEELGTTKKDWPSLLTGLLFGFSIVGGMIIIIDSVYYGTIDIMIGDKHFRWLDLLCPSFYARLLSNLGNISLNSLTWTITPINNLIYNSKLENLEEHGTHLRITHMFNFFVLFGPLGYVGIEPYYTWLDEKLGVMMGQLPGKKKSVVTISKTLLKKKVATNKPSGKANEEREEDKRGRVEQGKFGVTKLALIASIVFAFIILSLIPHQEMRFLVPMLVPLVLLGYKGIFGNESFFWLKVGWITFNLIFVIFMGVVHQGGVVPVILDLSAQPVEAGTTHHVVFYHTYMPPEHLFAAERSAKPSFAITDLKGESSTELRKTLLRIPEHFTYKPTDKIYVVAPETIDLDEFKSSLILQSRRWFHWSGENPPDSMFDLDKLYLNVFLYDTTKPLPRLVQPVESENTYS